MNVYVYEVEDVAPTECVGIIDSYSSLNFTKSFQGCGRWTLKGNFTQEARRILAVGRMIWVSPRVCGIIESIDFDTQDGTTTYTAYGSELKGILGYRIVWDTYNRNVNQRDWVNDLVARNTEGSRRLFSNQLAPSIDTATIDKQVSYTSLLEAVEDGCSAALTKAGMLLGFDVTCGEDGFVLSFTLLEGDDRTMESQEPYLVSRDMDNVSALTYTESGKESANVVKCGGEGEGAERKFSVAGDTSLSGFARREAFVDARSLQSTYKDQSDQEVKLTDAQYTALLDAKAREGLRADSLALDAESPVDTETALSLLGAKVSLVDRAFNVRTDDYVYEVNLIDEADGQLTTLTIGQGVEAKQIVL